MSTVCWFIRSGDDSRHAREFALNGVVAVGWARVTGLGDLRALEREKILALVDASGVSKTPTADTNELLAFRDNVEAGHIVVTPDSTTRELLIGEVIGDYEYLDPLPGGRLPTRPVGQVAPAVAT